MNDQLTAETVPLPDLDEYAGMSARDIALAVVHWPEGSEDQIRAIRSLRALTPDRHHNRPPLDQLIDDELAPFRARRDQLLEIAQTVVIIDDESAASVTDLIKHMANFEREVEIARGKRLQPYRDASKLISDRYGSLRDAVATVRGGADGRGGLRGALTAYDDRREAAAEAERQRLRDEARRREEQAAAARRKADEAAAAGKGSIDQHANALRAQDEADRLALAAEAVRPEPIRGQLGMPTRRRDIKYDIVDLPRAAAWLLQQPGLASSMRQAVGTILGSYFRSLGVGAVENGAIEIPGVKVWVEKGAVNVRR